MGGPVALCSEDNVWDETGEAEPLVLFISGHQNALPFPVVLCGATGIWESKTGKFLLVGNMTMR